MIGAAEFSSKDVKLFSTRDQGYDDDDNVGDVWRSISLSPQFEQYISFSRFKDFR